MTLTRANVDWIKARFRERVGNGYVYGGIWSPRDTRYGCDCSALAAHVLNGVLDGPDMTWQRTEGRHGGQWITTESWRPIEVGQRGPFGTITVARPQDIPADAAVKIALHHGPGGGANSHMWLECDGVRMESAGSKGCVTAPEAWPIDHSYGNDWAYLPGPIGAAATARPEGPEEPEGLLMALTAKQQQELYDKIMGYPGVPALAGKWPSRSMFADDGGGVDDTVGMILNTDGNAWNLVVIVGALIGLPEDVARIKRAAAGQLAPQIRADELLAARAVKFAAALEPLCGTLRAGNAPSGTTPLPIEILPPQPTPPPAPAPQHGGKPVLFTVNGFMGDMWQAMPADTARAVEDLYQWQPVGFNSGAFPLGTGRDDGVRELRRLITEVYPDRRFAFASYSLGAVVAADVFDQLRDGDLQHRLGDFIGGVSWGNPRREKGNYAGRSFDPGGAGIAGPDNLKNTPQNYLSYANPGDIYTCCPNDDVGENMTMVYNMVMLNWNGSLTGLMTEAAQLLGKPLPEVIDIALAVVNGLRFVGQRQAPHTQYPIDHAVTFLRRAVLTPAA